MTILPKKKHSESKKPDSSSTSDGRGRIRGAPNRPSPSERSSLNRSSDDYVGESFESREAADAACSTKRRHRGSPHRHKYHERHSDEAGYNSSDEHDGQNLEVVTEEMERQFEQALKEKKGLIIKRMAEDGACLFRAVADQVYGDQEMHTVVRKHCMDYMLKNMDYFSQYVTEDFRSYIRRKRENHCHGNHVEMQALSEMYNRTIEVYQNSIEPINIFHSTQKTDNEPIRLSYHSNVHYNSVINPNKPSVGVGLGLSGYKPWNVLVNDAMRQSEEWHIEQTYSSPSSSSSTSTSTESKRPNSPHHRDWERDIDSAPPTKSPRHSPNSSPSSPRHEPCFMGPSLSDCNPQTCPSSSSSSTVTCTKTSQFEPRPSCSTAVSNPPSPEQSQGAACQTESMYDFNQWNEERILAAVLAESQKEYLESLRKNAKENPPEPGCSNS
ncbi:OTU domain-containing protein 5-B-like isoform X2 [Actinia tenebrosa]|uniref:ubiquitinyl hydrolase 1 n=1 Tax=Actinia tenebrosa TaxID=6105 RepID=A0A6P8HAW9_ACTTE|nr:OTU domain-containing protein 5-B-like isoform X2 [Actinia tenebrosa]